MNFLQFFSHATSRNFTKLLNSVFDYSSVVKLSSTYGVVNQKQPCIFYIKIVLKITPALSVACRV